MHVSEDWVGEEGARTLLPSASPPPFLSLFPPHASSSSSFLFPSSSRPHSHTQTNTVNKLGKKHSDFLRYDVGSSFRGKTHTHTHTHTQHTI